MIGIRDLSGMTVTETEPLQVVKVVVEEEGVVVYLTANEEEMDAIREAFRG